MKTNSGKDKIILKKNESISDKNISRAYKTSVKTSVKTSDLNKIIELDSITTLEFVSHELKGILGSTIMCVYSIRDGFLGMLNFKQRATIETIIKNLRRLESTVKDFLDISRIEGGKISSKKLDVNVNIDIIREVEEAFLPEIYEKRLILENNIPDDLIIKTDRTLLLTVFNNLISNAIKYRKTEGKIIINFENRQKISRFSVYNDGVPISKKDKEKLFKKFSRIENETSKKIKGTGLGLFIVKNILNTLGGNIWVETKEKGNEFIFQIEGE